MQQKTAQSMLRDFIQQALERLKIDLNLGLALEHPADPSHGDFASTAALAVFPKLDPQQKSGWKSPRALAESIVDELKKLSPPLITSGKTMISDMMVAGPGFINFSLSPAYHLEEMTKVLSASNLSQLTHSVSTTGQKVMVEFTDPNPFKEFHIGHLYSNTVGEAISRLLEAHGAEIKRVCYQGDVGMHVAKSVWGMVKKFGLKFTGKNIQQALQELSQEPLSQRIKFLGQAYALGATAFEGKGEGQTTDQAEKDIAEIKQINFMTFKAGQDTLVEKYDWEPQVDYSQFLDQGEKLAGNNQKRNNQKVNNSPYSYEEIKLVYQTGRSWSLEYFDAMYERSGMGFDDYFFESVVGEYGVKIVKNFLEKGIFEESQGAIIFPGSKYGLHDRVFINSLGLPTYETKELGLAPEKYQRFAYDYSIIVTGNEIDEYFKVLLKALSFTNPELAAKTKHLSHGMVRLPEGKMSSRTGKILTGEWLLDQAQAEARKKIQDNDQVGNKAGDLAEKVGLGAIKYAFLKSAIGRDISFSFEDSLSFQGNSGPYLQYTYVRCWSVWQKATQSFGGEYSNINKYIDILISNKEAFDATLSKSELSLLRNIYTYFEILELATREIAPHHLAEYLHSLAQAFNAFYGENVILEKDKDGGLVTTTISNISHSSAIRLMLTAAVAKILQHGMTLLGVPVVEKM